MAFVQQRKCGLPALLALLLAGATLALGGCSDDDEAETKALAGSRAGVERYVVHLGGEAPDASAYKEALSTEPEKATRLAEELREQAVASRKGFVQALKAYDGRVVDHWWLTNAVTVELPAGNSASLRAIDGVVKVEPDQLLLE